MPQGHVRTWVTATNHKQIVVGLLKWLSRILESAIETNILIQLLLVH